MEGRTRGVMAGESMRGRQMKRHAATGLGCYSQAFFGSRSQTAAGGASDSEEG